MTLRSVVLGCGSYLPRRILTNAELAARIDTSDEWIVQRTGIRQRHIAADGEFTSHLAINAARAALDQCRDRRAGDRPDRACDLDARQHLSGNRGRRAARARHQPRRGLRPAGGLLGFRLRARHRRQFPALRRLQAGAGDRRRNVLAHSRLERPRHLRAVRRRRRRGRARGARAAGQVRPTAAC